MIALKSAFYKDKTMQEPHTIAFYRCNKLGDNIVAIPALYLTKKLYPNAKFVVITNEIGANLYKNFDFIDEIVLYDGGENLPQIIDKINADVLILSHRTSKLIILASQSKCPLIITWLHLKSLILPRFRHPKYLTKGKRRMLQSCIDLVRVINPRRFDKNFKGIALQNLPIQIKTNPQNVAFVDKFMLTGGGGYKIIIGINAFASNANRGFAVDDYIALGEKLAREFSEILVIFMNYKGSGYEFKAFSEPNIKVFVNDNDLLNLAELTRRLTLLLSVDTGNTHLADNLGTKILELIPAKEVYSWACGAYGNECELVILPHNWQKHYEFYKQVYFDKARAWVQRLLQDN